MKTAIVSWKTTVCSLITAIGVWASTQTSPGWLPQVGQVLQIIGSIGMGLFARDHDVSSERAGAQ